jgi:DNA-binding CsgD family transcriptional regulator
MRRATLLASGLPAPSLADWGLSADADLIYRCLLAFEPQTAGRLEQALGLSRRRVANGLDELLSVEAVIGGGRHAGWRSRKPDEVIAALRLRRHGRSRPGRRLAPVQGIPSSPVALDDGIRHLPTRALTRSRLADLVRIVRHEHLAMQPEPAYDAESARPAVSMDRTLLTRGVRMRVIGVPPLNGGDVLAAHGRRADDPWPDYREMTDVPAKLIVMDRRVAFVPVTADNLEHGYLEIAQADVVSALVALFERQWAAARSPQEQGMSRLSLSAREHALVALLAHGHTDTTAAEAMLVSRRTVSNTLRDLMDRLGVENRFQLGLAIGALGGVLPPGVERPGAGRPPSTSTEEP